MSALLRKTMDSVQTAENEINLSFIENTVIKIEHLSQGARDLSDKTISDIFVDREIKKELVDNVDLKEEKWEFEFDVAYQLKQEPTDQQSVDIGELSMESSIKEEPEGNAEIIRQYVKICNEEITGNKQKTIEHLTNSIKLEIKKNLSDVQTELKEKGVEYEHSELGQIERHKEKLYPAHMFKEEIAIGTKLLLPPGAGTDSLSSDIGAVSGRAKRTKGGSKQRRAALKAGRPGDTWRYLCVLCGTKCSCKSVLTRHMRVHTGEKPYTCDVCSRAFRQKQHLQDHILRHATRVKYCCVICDKKFSVRRAFTQHMRLHTDYKGYCCDICDKKFSQRSSLPRHMRLHTGYKPYRCDYCDKTFTNGSNLRRHVRVHTDDKPYRCDICDKRFTDNSHLRVHMVIHMDDKPHRCDICNKKFTQKVALIRHMNVHNVEKNYGCDVCDKKFNDKPTLTRHLKIHTGDKPYCCDVCDKKFTQRIHLTEHRRIHTGDKPYRCNYCDKKFTRSGDLSKHRRLRH